MKLQAGFGIETMTRAMHAPEVRLADLSAGSIAILDNPLPRGLTMEKAQKFVKEQLHIIAKPHDPALLPTQEEADKMAAKIRSNQAPGALKDPLTGIETGLPSKEQQALSSLAGRDQATYQALWETLGARPASDGKPAQVGRIDAQLALQEALLDNKLRVHEVYGNQKRTLAQAFGDVLDPAKTPLADGIDRRTLLAQLVQEVAYPVSVSQQHKGTCAATSSGQIMFSMHAPADYVDFVRQLASPSGKAKMPSGLEVKRPDNWNDGSDTGPNRSGKPGAPRNAGRSLVSKLVEPVFMDVAYGKYHGLRREYNNTLDGKTDPKHPGVEVGGAGQMPTESALLMENIFAGQQFATVYNNPRAFAASFNEPWEGQRLLDTTDGLLDYIKGNASPDHPVRGSVIYMLHGGHAILFTKARQEPVTDAHGRAIMDKKTGEAKKEWVYEWMNPWGRYESTPEAALRLQLTGLIIPTGYESTPLSMNQPDMARIPVAELERLRALARQAQPIRPKPGGANPVPAPQAS